MSRASCCRGLSCQRQVRLTKARPINSYSSEGPSKTPQKQQKSKKKKISEERNPQSRKPFVTKVDFCHLGLILKRETVVSSSNLRALRQLSKAINFGRNYPTLNFSEQLSAQVPARSRSAPCSDDGWLQVAAESLPRGAWPRSLLRNLSPGAPTGAACPDSDRSP